MTELNLVDVDTDKVVATVVPDGTGIKATGPQAKTVESLVMVRAKMMGISAADTLTRLASYGWSNGHLALVEKK